MMKLKWFVCFALLCSLTGARGNGMGTSFESSVVRSSNPVCRQIKDITLLSEKLKIDFLYDTYCRVTVKYTLWNSTDNDYRDIDYAFPIDYFEGKSPGNDIDIPAPIIKDVHFHCDGQQLPFQHSESTAIAVTGISGINAALDQWFYTSELEENVGAKTPSGISLQRRWYYTRFSVPKHAFVNLEVQYTLSSLDLTDGDSPLNINIEEYWNWGGVSLAYDFSPAASWGDGIIRDMEIEINGPDLSYQTTQNYFSSSSRNEMDYDLRERFRPKVLPASYDFQPKSDNSLIYRARNFDLKQAQPLHISGSVPYLSSIDLLRERMIAPSTFAAQASCNLKNYPVGNLTDLNLETAWVAKTGDWVEFTCKEAPSVDMAGFLVVNGYQKSEQTYLENNRVKRIRIDLEFKPGSSLYNEPNPPGTASFEMELPDNKYAPLFFENLLEGADYHDLFEWDNHIARIRFTILELFPGTKYDDTCITEILFLKNLPSGD